MCAFVWVWTAGGTSYMFVYGCTCFGAHNIYVYIVLFGAALFGAVVKLCNTMT